MAKSKKKDNGENISFEDALEKLETIVKQLERGELSLEDSLDNFAEGVTLSKACLTKLNYAEQQIDKILMEDQGKITEKPLELKGDDPC